MTIIIDENAANLLGGLIIGVWAGWLLGQTLLLFIYWLADRWTIWQHDVRNFDMRRLYYLPDDILSDMQYRWYLHRKNGKRK